MPTLNEAMVSLVTAIGNDIKKLILDIGSLPALTTESRNSIVSAINELYVSIEDIYNGGTIYDDGSIPNKTWSSSKIASEINKSSNELNSDITALAISVNGLSSLLSDFQVEMDGITTIGENVVRTDGLQSKTDFEKHNACANIGIGDYDYDFANDYNNLKL